MRQVVACFPVYRTYVGPKGWGEFDERNINAAVWEALQRNPALEPSIFLFIRRMLLPERNPEVSEPEYQQRLRFAMKFQQYTGPVQAKGVEDTAFYRYGPLLSLNEVGGDPARFGRTTAEFHEANRLRQEAWPLSMLASFDARHQARRGRARPHQRAVGDSGAVASRDFAMGARQRLRSYRGEWRTSAQPRR